VSLPALTCGDPFRPTGVDQQITVIYALAGIGWHTAADATLANTAAAMAGERRRVARPS
jgi:hypothetical protein